MSFFVRSPATVWTALLAGLAVLLLAATACDSDGGEPAAPAATAVPQGMPTEPSGETPEPTEAGESDLSQSPELMLASINAGGVVDDNDPSVDEFRSVLDVLEESCPDDRQKMADLAVSTHQTVTDRGLEITLLQMMRDLSENIPPDLDDLGISCAIALAAYVESEAPQ